MKPKAQFVVVLVTAPNLKTARMLATAALRAHLVACANLIPRIESHYWWRGELETSSELLLLLKTTSLNLAALEELVIARHPYDTPEFLVVPIQAGNRRYLQWLTQACGPIT